MSRRIAAVVEGHGEVKAVPILLRRIAEDLGVYDCEIRTPHRIGRDHMTGAKMVSAVRIQRAVVGEDGLVIVLYDSDDDEPEATIEATITALRSASCDAAVFVAVREFESWLLADIESLRGSDSIRDDASFDDDPERPRDAAGRLEDLMTESYKKTLHQARFRARLDLQRAAEASPSLRRFIDGVSTALLASA